MPRKVKSKGHRYDTERRKEKKRESRNFNTIGPESSILPTARPPVLKLIKKLIHSNISVHKMNI